MDFNFDTSPHQNEENNNGSNPIGNDGFQNMDSQPKITALDDMLNMNFQPLNDVPHRKNDNMFNMDLKTNNNINDFNNIPNKIEEEEKKRIEDRKKEAEVRRQKINEKIQKEEELRKEILKKARDYMIEFEEKRQEEITKRRKELEAKNSNENTNTKEGTNAESWGKINSNIDLKDSEYRGSKDVQRMREAMMNRTNDPNSEPIKNFFG